MVGVPCSWVNVLAMFEPQSLRPREFRDVVATLRHEHAVMAEVLHGLDVEARLLMKGSRIRPEFWRQAVEFLEHFLDRCHHEKEDRYLFPALEARGSLNDRALAMALRAEHEEGRALAKSMVKALNQRSPDHLGHVALLFCRRERAHMLREEDVLLPRVHESLGEEGLRQVAEQFRAHDEGLDAMIHQRCLVVGSVWLREGSKDREDSVSVG